MMDRAIALSYVYSSSGSFLRAVQHMHLLLFGHCVQHLWLGSFLEVCVSGCLTRVGVTERQREEWAVDERLVWWLFSHNLSVFDCFGMFDPRERCAGPILKIDISEHGSPIAGSILLGATWQCCRCLFFVCYCGGM